jgi:hypothetical protein
MKVTVTQTEVQYFEITKEIEMTAKEYAQYLKTGIVSQELVNDLCSETDEQHHTETRILSTIISK